MIDYEKAKAEIGARIKEIREKRYMTQEVLAEKVNLSTPQQISDIERGIIGVSLERFMNFCQILEIEADYLLFGVSLAGTETVLRKYIEKMMPEQLTGLIDLVKIYAKSCGIDEK